MSSFCSAKATHIFSAKKIQHIFVSLDVNFNVSLTNNIVSLEQLGPDQVSLRGLEKNMLEPLYKMVSDIRRFKGGPYPYPTREVL